MGRSKYLTELEEAALRAVMHLRDNAYGVSIGDTLEKNARRKVSLGALYRVLERLEDRGYLTARMGDPTAARGGRAKRFYRITGVGARALDSAEERRLRLDPQLRWREA